mmetsp:Transcript_28664/g.66092  ORF Transcript_28664/g.66092 Transcript_28664/m.66092 type:complete len:202 (-) Transcript_28664:663-1268(-)
MYMLQGSNSKILVRLAIAIQIPLPEDLRPGKQTLGLGGHEVVCSAIGSSYCHLHLHVDDAHRHLHIRAGHEAKGGSPKTPWLLVYGQQQVQCFFCGRWYVQRQVGNDGWQRLWCAGGSIVSALGLGKLLTQLHRQDRGWLSSLLCNHGHPDGRAGFVDQDHAVQLAACFREGRFLSLHRHPGLIGVESMSGSLDAGRCNVL